MLGSGPVPDVIARYFERNRETWVATGPLGTSRDGALEVRALETLDRDGEPVAVLQPGQTFVARLHLHAARPLPRAVVHLSLNDAIGTRVAMLSSNAAGHELDLPAGDCHVDCAVHEAPLVPATYGVDLRVLIGTEPILFQKNAATLVFDGGDFYKTGQSPGGMRRRPLPGAPDVARRARAGAAHVSAPRVSIVLPSFNGSAHLDEAVASVVAQTHKDFELLLVDDGSTDDTGVRMQAWAARDARIRVIRLDPNRGLPAALNEGFAHARGDVFGWTSDDNVYLPHAFELMLAALDAGAGLDGVCADYVRFDARGHETPVRVASASRLPLANVVGACFLYGRHVHEELGGFDAGLPLAEDYDFWLRARARFRFTAVHEVLYRYRDHAGSLTAQNSRAVYVATTHALLRQLPSLPRAERAHALLVHARRLFSHGEPRGARGLVRRALAQSPAVVLRAEHRRVLATALLGRRLVHAVRRLARRGERAVRLLVPDYLGGVTSYLLNLADARPAGGPRLELVWIRGPAGAHARNPAGMRARVDREAVVSHGWPGENLFAVLRRIRRRLSKGRGVVVASELFGLAWAARHGRGQAVVQILHGDLPMYYALAAEFEPHVDVFVAVSARIRDELARQLPERAADIRHLPSGVPIPPRVRARHTGPLRLCYAGRLDRAKGVLDLPEIDRRLAQQGVAARWTIAGAGPDADALRAGLAGGGRALFTGALSPETTRALLPEQDVLVLPSRGEGLSLALLEAMAAGVVPVASDLASGMREVIDPDATGLLAHPEHPEEFAAAIARLDRDRDLLERLSRAAAARIRARHALEPRARAFYELLADLETRPLPLRPRYRRGPSRLDRPWLPNALVRAIRRVTS